MAKTKKSTKAKGKAKKVPASKLKKLKGGAFGFMPAFFDSVWGFQKAYVGVGFQFSSPTSISSGGGSFSGGGGGGSRNRAKAGRGKSRRR